MIPRFVLPTLFALFAVLIITFGVLMGGYGIATAVGDADGGYVLWWLAMSCIILLTIDCLLLLATLTCLHIDETRKDKCQPPDVEPRPSKARVD